MTRISLDEYFARNDNVELPSAKRMRSAQGQRKYNAMLEARKAEARTRNRYLVSSMALLVVLISVIGIGVQSNRAKITGSTTATNASASNGVVLGKAGKVTIDIYEDFQCPYCQQFQAAAGADIDALISSDEAQVRYHMVSFLDSSSNGNQYSTRAANASLLRVGHLDVGLPEVPRLPVLDGERDQHPTGRGYERQNRRRSRGLRQSHRHRRRHPDDVPDVRDLRRQHKGLVEAITETWSKRGYNGTPILVVNGKNISNPSKATLDAAVKKASASATAGVPLSGQPTIIAGHAVADCFGFRPRTRRRRTPSATAAGVRPRHPRSASP